MKYYTKYLLILIALLTCTCLAQAPESTYLLKGSKNNSPFNNKVIEEDTTFYKGNVLLKDISWDIENFTKIIGIFDKYAIRKKILIPGNGKFNSYNPLIVESSNLMFFSSFNSNAGPGGEDILFSEKKNGNWDEPKGLFNLNTLSNEAPLFYSKENETLYIYANYASSQGNGDIFKAVKKADNYYNVESLPAPVNTRFFESDAFLANDSVMFFSSDRPGSIGDFHPKGVKFENSFWGNTDLYICLKKNGKWNEVINLGNVINTPLTERTPFLSEDGNILFFSSNGQPLSKGLDVYYSLKLNLNSWTEWSEPANIGSVVNTEADEWGFKISEENNSCYFTDDRNIYTVKLPNYLMDNYFVDIAGVVRNEKNEFIESKISWGIISEDEYFYSLKSNENDGKFSLFLPAGKHYIYKVEKENYIPFSGSIDLRNTTKTKKINLDIVLLSKTFNLDGSVSLVDKFLFDYNEAEIKEDAKPGLSNIVYALKIMDKSIDWKLNISGHTDSIGSKQYNLVLSEKRAKAVYDFLIANGFNPGRFKIEALGESNPVAENKTEEGRAKNRRVVLKIVE